ncbi:hypothetical protein HMPREF9334_01077 [Selenomonas infelix ATCC 43532]|uniref:Oxaloacetate decarboxylase gamma chain n=1 Tax=Selenomonas infelix ATCC 43532 TaxID=679201 RepID=G5GP96_9FIRM|nr:OadG family protein [Selenomonas infelix]EHG21145.1 hypothetical protein HMPREF9334_01077 [Selenomonas infelix ATCC 43532]
MHQPVTDNPFVIMIINMVIVFAVLTAIWGLIELTHRLDPTKKKAEPPAAAPAAPAPVAAAPAAPAVPAGLSMETVAVIAAAVTACGYSAEQIHAIRPAEQPAWRNFGRASGMRTPR